MISLLHLCRGWLYINCETKKLFSSFFFEKEKAREKPKERGRKWKKNKEPCEEKERKSIKEEMESERKKMRNREIDNQRNR